MSLADSSCDIGLSQLRALIALGLIIIRLVRKSKPRFMTALIRAAWFVTSITAPEQPMF